MRLKFDGNENFITILEINPYNKRFTNTNFFSKYGDIFAYSNFIGEMSYLKLYDHPDKYLILKDSYELLGLEKQKEKKRGTPQILLSKENNNLVVSYDEFEFNIDEMLEEFKLFCKFFELNEDEKKIISAFVDDPNLKSNIKFCGIRDDWITY